ncbi:MAG: hypothetical protein IT564_08795 [Rhodospirillales bacterium]|nr:hypothetical protein [Rhodospirillales bacterium]
MDIGPSPEQLYHWFGLNRALVLWLSGIHFPAWDWAVGVLGAAAAPAHFPWYVAAALLAAYLFPRLVNAGDAIVFAVGFAPAMLAGAHLKAVAALPRSADLIEAGAPFASLLRAGDGLPSAPAAFVFLFAAGLSPGAPPTVRFLLWAFAGLAGLARIAAGNALPADVAGGAILGVLAAMFLRALLRLIARGE